MLEHGRRTDVVELLPASMKTVDLDVYQCHVADHITAGMYTHWMVRITIAV